MQHQQDALGAVTAQRCGYDADERPSVQHLELTVPRLARLERHRDDFDELAVTHALHKTDANRVGNSDVQEPQGRLIHQGDPAVGVEYDDTVRHGIKYRRQLVALTRQVPDHVSDSGRHRIERVGHLSGLRCLDRRYPVLEVAPGQPARPIDHRLHRTRDPADRVVSRSRGGRGDRYSPKPDGPDQSARMLLCGEVDTQYDQTGRHQGRQGENDAPVYRQPHPSNL